MTETGTPDPLIELRKRVSRIAGPLLDEYRQIRLKYLALEETHDAVKNRVEELIGTDKGLEWSGGRVLWSSVSGRRTIDWQAVAKALNAPPDLIGAHTTTSAPSRRFTVKLNEDDSHD